VHCKGQDIKGAAPHYLARTGIGFVPDDRRILAELTVWENGWEVSRSDRRILHKALNLEDAVRHAGTAAQSREDVERRNRLLAP
jgi:ABC-type branched-subunit amino acid transport system ATPase component